MLVQGKAWLVKVFLKSCMWLKEHLFVFAAWELAESWRDKASQPANSPQSLHFEGTAGCYVVVKSCGK